MCKEKRCLLFPIARGWLVSFSEPLVYTITQSLIQYLSTREKGYVEGFLGVFA